jgi:hypothetical protein
VASDVSRADILYRVDDVVKPVLDPVTKVHDSALGAKFVKDLIVDRTESPGR